MAQADTLIEYVPYVYISIQGILTLLVSIAGAKVVRNQFLAQKDQVKPHELQIEVQKQPKQTETADETSNEEKEQQTETKTQAESAPSSQHSEEYKSLSKMHFCKLWFKIVWKMRSVYGAFAVHMFDVLTDILIIIEWWHLKGNDPEGGRDGIAHIDARTMAISAIIVLLFHKCVSVIAFWAKEANAIRCILQFFDLLIFEEIYTSHKKILVQFRNQSQSKDAHGSDGVDTTSSFKFVRNLEAIFESIPQAVLQLVFLMRTSAKFESGWQLLAISILSIMQSIISMTNSILKNDNVYMALPKWKKHKQRLPPTLPFMKHLLSRLSEVIYRIGLLALFWTVCEGTAFSVLMGVEFLILICLVVFEAKGSDSNYSGVQNADDLFLRVQALIVMPSELVYDVSGEAHASFRAKLVRDEIGFSLCLIFLGFCCCCYNPAVWLSSLCFIRYDHYIHPSLRIGVSMAEWIVLITWVFIKKDRFDFVFSMDHGLILAVFIVSVVCYLIQSQYLSLFPDFSLPRGVSIRSPFGYAFNGELEELQRLKLPKKYKKKEIEFWDAECIKRRAETYKYNTCAMFALANDHHHVVHWLETEKGATIHKQYIEVQLLSQVRKRNKSQIAKHIIEAHKDSKNWR
eukprot:995783_1